MGEFVSLFWGFLSPSKRTLRICLLRRPDLLDDAVSHLTYSVEF
jgi:hypothetical protein